MPRTMMGKPVRVQLPLTNTTVLDPGFSLVVGNAGDVISPTMQIAIPAKTAGRPGKGNPEPRKVPPCLGQETTPSICAPAPETQETRAQDQKEAWQGSQSSGGEWNWDAWNPRQESSWTGQSQSSWWYPQTREIRRHARQALGWNTTHKKEAQQGQEPELR